MIPGRNPRGKDLDGNRRANAAGGTARALNSAAKALYQNVRKLSIKPQVYRANP
jgi:hypothetical protein